MAVRRRALLFAAGVLAVLLVGAAPAAGKPASSAPPLTNHGGPVLIQTRVYSIFLRPAGYDLSSAYINAVNNYFTDLYGGISSGMDSALYTTVFEYVGNDATGSPNGGRVMGWYGFDSGSDSAIDTTPFFGNACTDGHTVICLNSGALQYAIESTRQQKGWPTTWGSYSLPRLWSGFNSAPYVESMYFLFLPRNVGYCWFDNHEGANQCAFTQSCGFHDFYDHQGQPVVFAVIPYAAGTVCDYQQRPNGNDADASVKAMSHEHFEMLTDPFSNAWWDSSGTSKTNPYLGDEIADQCNSSFGPVYGSGKNRGYTQVFYGVDYYIQQEWSNTANACVSAAPYPYAQPALTTPASPGAVPGTFVVRQN